MAFQIEESFFHTKLKREGMEPEPEPVAGELSWTQRWADASKERECVVCKNKGYGNLFIVCCDCGAAFHKICLDPLRYTPWEEGVEWLCDECDLFCVVCEGQDPPPVIPEEEDTTMPASSNDCNPPSPANTTNLLEIAEEGELFWFSCGQCGDKYHSCCLEPEDRVIYEPETQEEGEEEEEPPWICPNCLDEQEEEAEWAAENVEFDDTEEAFHRSECECDQCKETNTIVDKWKEMEPRNDVEAFIKKAIDKMDAGVNFQTDDALFLEAGRK